MVNLTSDGKTDIYSVETSSKDADNADSFDGTVTTIGSDVYTLVTEENKDTFKTNGTTDFTKEYTYVNDELSKICTAGITTSYGYNAENFISILENTLNDVSQVYGYAYDDNGNITTETLNIVTSNEVGATVETNQDVNYTYDEYNQLKTADYGDVLYEYIYDNSDDETAEPDNRGNITKKIVNADGVAQTVEYVYDTQWKDKLISYNGQSISYDTVGNPTEYLGHNLEWSFGRQLTKFDTNTYTYNEDGIRTSKTVDGITTTYYLDGTNIIEQNDGTNTLHFYYDSNDEVIGFTYNEADYFYVKNAMSDIIGIVDDSGNLIASYVYDAWGKVLSVTGSNVELGNLNPFRYRSYYYDADIEMYYLQSRYYDAEVGRFINCDDVNYIGVTESEVSYNPFAYCENNPVNWKDNTGLWKLPNWAKATIGIIALAGSIGLTLVSGGSLAPLLISVAVSTSSGAIIGYFKNGKQGIIDGAADGFMWGSIFALTSSLIKSIKVAKIGTSFGKLGKLTKYRKIKIKAYTSHAYQRIYERGISKSLLDTIIRTGKVLDQGGKYLYVSKKGALVITAAGELITAYLRSDYDSNMLKLIKLLFK